MIDLGRGLVDRLVFRPAPALLLFGGVTLASNLVWYGTGLFIGPLAGAAVTAIGIVTWGAALVSLRRRRRELAALGVFIIGAVAVPALALMALRWRTGAPVLLHDGAYQTEEAMRLLLAGRDPYGMDYTQTSMARWHWYVNLPLDPALFHYVYNPLTFLAGIPFLVLARLAHLPFDVRLVLLLAAIAAGLALSVLPWRWELRFVALCALFLDPFFYLPQGRNDILFLAAVIAGSLAWSRGRPVPAAWGFGLALAFKQFSLFLMAPLVVALLAKRSRGDLSTGSTLGAAAGLVLPLAVTVLPFLIWNPGAYWTDTVGVVTGAAPHSFAIRGFGVAELMVILHLLPGPDAYFPFGLLQAAIALPILAFGLPRVWREPSTASVLTVGAWTTVGALLASRYLNDSHLAILVYLVVFAGAAGRAARDAAEEVRGRASGSSAAA
jgi:Glycosyltransferase family 87